LGVGDAGGRERVGGGGEGREGRRWREIFTIEFLQHPLYGPAAASAGHGYVELVVVFGHFLVPFFVH
jgi:hypothetical protein